MGRRTAARRRVRIADPDGLHARPCARVAAAAERFRADAALAADGRRADARSVLSMLGLGILSSAEIEVHATGADAEECVAAIAAVLSEPPPR